MQRYSAASCSAGVSSGAVGGQSARDTNRADSSFALSGFSLNQRRQSQLTPYKLKCEKEPLNNRLGPPDFYPQSPNCPEETLTRESLQHGYKETVDGLEEAREISLSQLGTFTRPVVLKCKEAIRKRHRAINESRAQKRKAGQVYGVPLSGSLLTKPCAFPEQRPCSEDFRKKWIEGLSQQHKRLRSLADHVPHGYRRRSLFEVLIRQNVPLLRATWFIKVTYLNQVRPGSTSVSPVAPDKTQLARSELWTKDVIEYFQYLLDEFFTKDGSLSTAQRRDQSPSMLLAGLVQNRGDSGASTLLDGEGPSVHFKWWYMVRILHWHHAEGLLIPSHIIDWILNQLQEKESFDALQLLLPIISSIIESIALSQTYARSLVEVVVRYIQEPLPGASDLVDNSHRAYTASALVEMLRYLIVAVPDTIVALDCFPIPPCILSDAVNGTSFFPNMVSEDAEKAQCGPRDFATMYSGKGRDAHSKFLSLDYIVSSIQKRADNLAKAVSPGVQGHGVAKAVQALDKALILGDVRGAYNVLFDDLCDGGVEEGWIAEVSPGLRSSLKWIGTVSGSFVCSVFFLCEWAACDFRDCRTAVPHDLKLTGTKDFSQVYMAALLLKLKMEDMCSISVQFKTSSALGTNSLAKGASQHDSFSGKTVVEDVSFPRKKSKIFGEGKDSSDSFKSPGPMHDILVCWIDQHEVDKGEGCKRLQLLIMELILSGIFHPQAYVRQLIVSGVMDRNETPLDLDRQKRHYRILKQLPGPCLREALEEARIAVVPISLETMCVYSNERHLVLHGFLSGRCVHSKNGNTTVGASKKRKDIPASGRDGPSPTSLDHWKSFDSASSPLPVRNVKTKFQVAELKAAISNFLHLPNSYSISTDIQADESQGSLKRPIGSIGNKIDVSEGPPSCEECRRAKRQKTSEESSSFLQGFSSNALDDEDSWWVRKGPKSLEPLKVDPPKLTKHPSRGRQKIVRKTQSLAQLAAARIEGSQGASTSHVCDNKISCPHHRTGMEGETPKSMDEIRTANLTNVVTIGKALKHLRLLEKRTITLWLVNYVKQLIEGTAKTARKMGQCTGPFSPVDDRAASQWKLGEDELSAILYLLDVSYDLISAIKFLLWLLPKVLTSTNSTVYGGRNTPLLPKNMENHACEVGEAFLLSSIQRYENVVVAADLLPDVLSATMLRVAAGTVSSSPAFVYARNLLKKYGNVVSVARWEKSFKAMCDQRVLSELESGRTLDGEFGFSPGIPAGVEDPDDYFRQKISSRLPRAGPSMKEIVQRQVEEAVHYFYGKERKLFAAATQKGPGVEKWDDGYQRAQKIVLGLMECIRQNSAAAQEGDPSLVASAVSAIVGNVGPTVAKMPDFTLSSNYPKFPSAISSLNCARCIVHLHITCLCLLKEALGERHSRVFEIALAAEAFSVVAGAFAPVKAPRSQFQLSPEVHDSNTNLSNDILNNSAKVLVGRAAKAAASVSSLVIGALVHGVVSLERMVTVFRLREGLDILQLIKSGRTSSNGISRTMGAFKVDNSIEVYVHWFRVLVGNCRTISDGLVVELLGEPYILALSRMQRMLPLSLVFPPAYSILGMVIWKPYIPNNNISTREEVQLSLASAIGDAIRHQPFRDVCLRDTYAFYDLLASDVGDSEFAAMLELQSLDKHLKTMAIVPLRARLFLNALLDCKMPESMLTQDDGTWVPGHGEPKAQHAENEKRLLDQLVHVLDTLQLAKFHWQWVELRLLLNEQVLIEKIEASSSTSVVEAIRSLSPHADNFALSESENNFTEIVLTRLLVRPDAAPLYSEVVHLLGRSLEESLLLHAKWFLAGHDVLFGRKSIRQRLVNIAQLRGLSTKVQFWKPWGWSSSVAEQSASRGDKRKFEATSLEEGEVVEEGIDLRRSGKTNSQISDAEGLTEKALVELVLPCIDRSSSDSHNTFASELIKQMNNIEQHLNALTRAASKQAGSVPPGVEGAANKSNSRKSIRGGSPGLGRRLTGAAADSAPPSPAALRASMWLRLQFLLRLLPIIYADREPSGRNMRHMLASVILRLLGSRVVHEDADMSFYPTTQSSPAPAKREVVDSPMEASAAASLDLSGESLFEWFLSVFHGLLSSCKPSWLKPKSSSKSTVKSSRDFSVFDREVAESLQNDLDRMQLPETIRWRLQSAMPVLPPYLPRFISCQPPAVSTAAIAALQSSSSMSSVPCGAGFIHHGNSNPSSQRNPVVGLTPRPTVNNVPGKSKQQLALLQLDQQEMEMDPWTLLEDGTGSSGCPTSSTSSSSSNGSSSMVVGGLGLGLGSSSDHSSLSSSNNLKACSWLKGAVRVRRTELTYIGAVDDDS
ncbi:Mediator complex [Macleaya cordata]|uniref:Mediator complex n=1 Tax=Macleaya cordata TaxID=56857 RepID=A0A200PYX0_MACCD|nr:Mediator complex [Macleaya cordata]